MPRPAKFGLSRRDRVGLSFFGRAWSEPTLIRIAYGFEQTIQARRVPRFQPTV